MLWSIGFLVTFLFGVLTGIIIASPALDFHVTDTYLIVAHFHYTVFGTVVFAMFSGFYFWWPKLTGRMLDERLGKIHFWMLFVGFQTNSSSSTCWAWTVCRVVTRTTYPRTASRLSTRSLRWVPSCSGPPPPRSSTTSGGPGAERRWSESTIRGVMRFRWSGRRPARRHDTTSSRSRGFAPSVPLSTCTIPIPPHQMPSDPIRGRCPGPWAQSMLADLPSRHPRRRDVGHRWKGA